MCAPCECVHTCTHTRLQLLQLGIVSGAFSLQSKKDTYSYVLTSDLSVKSGCLNTGSGAVVDIFGHTVSSLSSTLPVSRKKSFIMSANRTIMLGIANGTRTVF